jgi:hypothetical protein
MEEPHDDDSGDRPLNERILDLLVFVPAGIATSVVEEIPKLAVRGREHLEVRVSSARSIGEFVVKAGHDELRRRSERLLHRTRPVSDAPAPPETGGTVPPPARPTAAPADPSPTGSVPNPTNVITPTTPATTVTTPTAPTTPTPRTTGNGHVPPVATLAIPGFDTLSASQVVQRLDGLTRGELVAVRAYESSTRGRRTILSRVDQLLDERS